MKEKIIGILGGMGPQATIDLFQKIVKLTPAKKDQEHLRIIIDNNPKIPDRTRAILYGGENPLPELVRTAQNLEKAGVDFTIIACNTAHYYFHEIQKMVNIPILNMMQVTASYIHHTFPSLKQVSLFATEGTIHTGLYQAYLDNFAIEVLIPSKTEQKQLMEIIYGVKEGQDLDLLNKQIIKTAELQIEKGAQAIIAGCTEIPLVLKDGDIPIPVIDPTLILAKKAIEEATNNNSC
jgi:aspartate racemase